MIHEHEKNEASKDDAATIKVADLPLGNAEGEAVKGGPIYLHLGDVKGDPSAQPRRGGG